MFKRIFLFFIIVFLGVAGAFGQDNIEELRRNLRQAPDSDKANILVCMAGVYESDMPDSCVFYALKASEAARATQQDAPLIDAETMLGRAAFAKGYYAGASMHQKNALDASLRIPDWDAAARCYYDLGVCWLFRNNYAEAVDNLKKGLTVAKERNNPKLLGNYYRALIDVYRKLNNSGAVLEYYPLLTEADSMAGAEALNDSLTALRKEFDARMAAETEKASRAAGQLQPAPVSPRTDVILIWAVLATLFVAAAVIYRRYRIAAVVAKNREQTNAVVREFEMMKHNQSASFRFLTQYAYTGIDRLHKDINRFVDSLGADILPAPVDALNRLNNDVFALYGFYQNFMLLLQAQSGQLTPELSTVNIPQLATNLLADYAPFAAANEIRLVNDVQNNVFVLADERLIDTVLRNLMSNAFKYTSPKGLITLGAKENHTDMEIWVTDDGIGLTPEQTDKLFVLSENLYLPGKSDLKGYGLGLAVCKALVETCKGRLWAETKPDEGFCIRFSLPKAGK